MSPPVYPPVIWVPTERELVDYLRGNMRKYFITQQDYGYVGMVSLEDEGAYDALDRLYYRMHGVRFGANRYWVGATDSPPLTM